MRYGNRRRAGRGDGGLTLLEVMVVVIILGLIATIVTREVVSRVEKARVGTAKVQMRAFMDALDGFALDNGFYPSSDQGLDALVRKPSGGRIPERYDPAAYMPAIPLDPWSNEYIYSAPSPRGKYEIVSLGRDGMEGGEGYDADISSIEVYGASASSE